MDSKHIIPIHLKLALTVREAAAYSNIGINRIDATPRTVHLRQMPHHPLCRGNDESNQNTIK